MEIENKRAMDQLNSTVRNIYNHIFIHLLFHLQGKIKAGSYDQIIFFSLTLFPPLPSFVKQLFPEATSVKLKTYKNLIDVCEYGSVQVLTFIMKLIQFPRISGIKQYVKTRLRRTWGFNSCLEYELARVILTKQLNFSDCFLI